MNKYTLSECRDCHLRHHVEWMAPSSYAGPLGAAVGVCDQFVRFHWHIDGECMKWWGLNAEHPAACPDCGSTRQRVAFAIRGKVTNKPCSDKCVGARGHTCECECGGANHGVGAGR